MSSLADVVANLGVKYDDTGAKKARAGLDSLISGAKKAVAALAAVGAAHALKRVADEVAAAGDAIDKASGRIGVSTDALQELRFAADQTGVAQSGLDVALQRLSRRYAQAAKGGGSALKAFQQLGIEMRDKTTGSLRPVDDVLADISAGLAATADESERTRLAFQFFDTEGVGLVNTLKDGPEALQALRDEGRRLGAVMDRDLIRKTVEYTDSSAKLSTSIQALKNNLANALLPGLTRAADRLTRFAVAIREPIKAPIARFIGTIAQALDSMGWAVRRVWDGVRRMFAPTTALGKLMQQLSPYFKYAAAALAAWMAPITSVAAAIFVLVDDLRAFSEGADSLIGRGLAKLQQMGVDVPGIVDRIRLAWSHFREALDAAAQAVADFARDTVAFFKPLLRIWGDIFGRLFGAIFGHVSQLVPIFARAARVIWPIIQDVFLFTWDTAKWLFQTITVFIQQFTRVLIPIIENVISPLVRGLAYLVLGLVNVVAKVVWGVVKGSVQTFRGAVDLYLHIVQGLLDGISAAWSWLTDTFRAGVSLVMTGGQTVYDWALGLIGRLVDRVRQGIAWAKDLLEPILDWFDEDDDKGPAKQRQIAPGATPRPPLALTPRRAADALSVVTQGAEVGASAGVATLPQPVLSAPPAAGGPRTFNDHSSVSVTVTASPGMDESALAERVRQAIVKERDRENRAAYRDLVEGAG